MDVLKGFFQKHGWRYLPGMAFLILNAALDVVPARLLGDAVDLMRESVIDQGAVLRKLIAMVAVAALIFATRTTWRAFINGNARRMEMWLRDTLFTHLQRLGPDFFNKQKTEDGFSVLRLLPGMFALWTGAAAREKHPCVRYRYEKGCQPAAFFIGTIIYRRPAAAPPAAHSAGEHPDKLSGCRRNPLPACCRCGCCDPSPSPR